MSGKAPIPTPRTLPREKGNKQTHPGTSKLERRDVNSRILSRTGEVKGCKLDSTGEEHRLCCNPAWASQEQRSTCPNRSERPEMSGYGSGDGLQDYSRSGSAQTQTFSDYLNEHNEEKTSDYFEDLEGPDLSALICSVEQDIMLLEQLEVRSCDRRGSLPLPLSFMSADLLSLPGYRPGKDSRNFGSPASRDTSPSSETNSRPASPPYSPSPPSWRPDEVENKAVVNPGYDALLYRRLYNTPPPPLPPKSGRRRRNSDSAVSDCSPPSPDTPLSPAESYLAGQLAQHTARPRQVFCPLCLAAVYNPDQLHTHLLASHPQELHLLRVQEFSSFQPETCPCCNAQFLRAGLSLRHIVHQHPEFVCGLFSPTLHQPGSALHQPGPSLPRSLPATPPPQRHTFCRVCGQKFLLKQIRLLSLHYHQQHLRQLNNVISRLSPLSPDSCFSEEHHYTDPKPENNYLNLEKKSNLANPKHLQFLQNRILPNNYMTPNNGVRRRLETPVKIEETISGYNDRDRLHYPGSPSQYIYESIDSPQVEKYQNEQKFSRNLNLGSFRQRSQDSKRLKKTDNSDPHRSRRNSFTEIQDRKRDRTPQRCRQTRSFRREGGSRLTGLETYQGLPQPEPPSLPITGIGSESDLLEPDGLSLSYSRYGTDLLFRCNLCGERFADNGVLLVHLKSRHLAVSRALKPQYSCGQCPARFFKNSFLIKHSLTHQSQN